MHAANSSRGFGSQILSLVHMAMRFAKIGCPQHGRRRGKTQYKREDRCPRTLGNSGPHFRSSQREVAFVIYYYHVRLQSKQRFGTGQNSPYLEKRLEICTRFRIYFTRTKVRLRANRTVIMLGLYSPMGWTRANNPNKTSGRTDARDLVAALVVSTVSRDCPFSPPRTIASKND